MSKKTNDLELQIEALRNEHSFKTLVCEKLDGIKTLAYLTGHNNEKKRIVATCADADQFKTVLAQFPATNDSHKIGSAGKNELATINSPFRIDIDNPARCNQFSPFQIKISYFSDDVDICCELPIELVKDFVFRSERKITDSEHHYFTGYSYKELYNLNVPCYKFNCPNQISWYGGNKTLTDTYVTSEIIDFITK